MSNAEQEEFWSTSAGQAWVAMQAEMDALFQPVLDLVLERAALKPGAHVIDVGCGTGASVLQAAQAVGPAGHVTGLDISPTMLDLARQRLDGQSNTALLRADAQTYSFVPGTFDALISRFGVMFFEDTFAAFANMAKALRPGAPLTMAAWGPAPQNPFFMKPAAIATDILGPMEKTDRTLPGPFAFEDRDRIIPMLQAAGLADVSAEPVNLHLTPSGTPHEMAEVLCQIGPAERALRHFEPPEAQRDRVAAALADWLSSHETENGLEIPALIYVYQAKAPG